MIIENQKHMKPLLTYIEEARETVGKLPFTQEEFDAFLVAASDYDDDSEAYQKIEHAVCDMYGEKVWLGFRGWCEGTRYNSDSKDMYNILCNMPKNRIEKILGAGSFGAAVELSNGMVCKIYHKNTPMEQHERIFFEHCMKHTSDVFPKVYKLGTNYVVMEKLNVATKKCELYSAIIDPWKAADRAILKDKMVAANIPVKAGPLFTFIDWAKGDKKVANLPDFIRTLDGDAREVADWAMRCVTELKEMGIVNKNVGDMKPANLGERKDGSIIWFDL